jgi:hypothetical protein
MTVRSGDLIAGICVVTIIVAFVLLAIDDCNKRQHCRDTGGTVVEHNCRMTTTCRTVSCGQNCSSTTCTPTRVCDWRCDRPPAERE